MGARSTSRQLAKAHGRAEEDAQVDQDAHADGGAGVPEFFWDIQKDSVRTTHAREQLHVAGNGNCAQLTLPASVYRQVFAGQLRALSGVEWTLSLTWTTPFLAEACLSLKAPAANKLEVHSATEQEPQVKIIVDHGRRGHCNVDETALGLVPVNRQGWSTVGECAALTVEAVVWTR